MHQSLQTEIPQEPPFNPRPDHIDRARKLLAKELNSYLDHHLTEEDLTPISDLPSEYQGNSYNSAFGFSVGMGFEKKIFVIRFLVDSKGEPIFKLSEVADPTHHIQRLTGKINRIYGRSQIERVLAGN